MSASSATLICWNKHDCGAVLIIIGTDSYVSLQGEACAWLIEQGRQSKREALEGIAADRRAWASVQASARRGRMSNVSTRLRFSAELEDGK